ncbi:ATP-binding domain-containing protein [Pseudonocardia sp. S2-4]|uniref:ATP-binding domain-containing protein n=2 Tax=Pseudonocardia humida TaxID=2800819 RepID=A0ABT0ZTL1_9PSEU|nr:UvrD-helicase domain-containing protein [Pseudonocardia humida]MCO1654070.1 ATP-binding domain-containing protein [Pseudonocardia humida]
MAHEQAHLTELYAVVDAMRAEVAQRIAALSAPAEEDEHDADRDAELAWNRRQAARLKSVERGLCFGRLDTEDGASVHIGRTGLFRDGDEDGGGATLLLDWRAPAARPFYTATAMAPQGVRRRRRISTRDRTVVDLDDELLTASGAGGEAGLTGEAALLAAVTAGRSGRMRDIVATLQSEQDRIIRSEQTGVLVVEGGPGTGKTAVALHRAAYLLYSRRHLLARGVLVVGPSRVFIDYIGQVLPGLGEDAVVAATIPELRPGLVVERVDPPRARVVKGAAAMAGRLAAAVAARVVRPTEAVELEFEGQALRLDPVDLRRARRAARRSGLPHNRARLVFQRELVGALADRIVAALEAVVVDESGRALDGGDADGGLSPADVRALEAAGFVVDPDDPGGPVSMIDEADAAALRGSLLADAAVGDALDALWPELEPPAVLEALLADPAGTCPDLTADEAAALRRGPGGWSAADVPLLDELAALIGSDAPPAAGEGAGGLAERAAADPTWVFGHVVVDEAQELSEMAWRMLMRRCPSRSMTVVGDLAQTGDPAGAASWDRVLGPHLEQRWELVRLSVNYRTPTEIMDAAEDLLAAHPGADGAPGRVRSRSVRSAGTDPWRVRTSAAELPDRVAELVAAEAAALDEGRVAVIAPAALVPALAAALAVPAEPDPERTVVLLTPELAKGLEFDAVLIADPAAVLAGSARGVNDLYVAMTRATHRLGIVHPGPPPAGLAGVPEREPIGAR